MDTGQEFFGASTAVCAPPDKKDTNVLQGIFIYLCNYRTWWGFLGGGGGGGLPYAPTQESHFSPLKTSGKACQNTHTSFLLRAPEM